MTSLVEENTRTGLTEESVELSNAVPAKQSRTPLSPATGFPNLHLPPITGITSPKLEPLKPDIKILCMKCEEEVSIRQLKKHRELHQALYLLRYTMATIPTTVKQLLKRRRALIKRLNESATSEDPVSIKKLQKLNTAYEHVKAEIEGTKTILREVELYVQPSIKGYSTQLSCALAFGVCEDRNERWRSCMEDRYCFKDYFCNDPQSGFFAVYDGYNGPVAAEKCARYLHEILSDKIETVYRSDATHSEVESQVITAFRQTYKEMDEYLLFGINENSRNRWSGCSAVTCLLRGNNLFVANAGNVRAILCKGDGSVVRLSPDHSPWNKKERKRIKRTGDICKSEKTALVNGLISSTRGLGNHGDPHLKTSVIHNPEVKCVPLDDSDQFLILASNGIWEVFSEQEVLLLLDDIMPELDVKSIVRRMLKPNGFIENEKENKNDNFPATESEDSKQNQSNLDTSRQSDDTNSNDNETVKRKTSHARKEEKSVALAKALSERLVESALYAGCKENVTVAVVLLKGCPLQMFLLPSI